MQHMHAQACNMNLGLLENKLPDLKRYCDVNVYKQCHGEEIQCAA